MKQTIINKRYTIIKYLNSIIININKLTKTVACSFILFLKKSIINHQPNMIKLINWLMFKQIKQIRGTIKNKTGSRHLKSTDG